MADRLLVGFVAELISISRIESAARSQGMQVEWIESVEKLRILADHAHQENAYTSHFRLDGDQGQEGIFLLELLTIWKPSLILFDLGNAAIPWQEWVSLLKSAPASRRIPVVCYGSHVKIEDLRAARRAGAEAALPRSAFLKDIGAVLERHSKKDEAIVLRDSCQVVLHPLALEGISLFNNREFFEAHEALELAWKEDSSPGRELYRAMLQVAVAYYHIQRGNFQGALKMFMRLRQWIDPLPDECRGVDVASLRKATHAAFQEMLSLGRHRIGEFDPSLFKTINYRE